MPPIARRAGRPGLIGLAARTAVVSGTATAMSGSVARKQAAKAREEAEIAELRQQAAAAAAPTPPAPPAPPAAVPAAAPAPAGGGDDLIAKIGQLAQLHAAGVLSDEEFAAAKAKLLA